MMNPGKQEAGTNFKISERKDILKLMERINESIKQRKIYMCEVL